MKRSRCQAGFTLLEIVVVLAILVVVVAIAIPVYRNYVVRARVAEIVVNYEEIKTELSDFYGEPGACVDRVNALTPAYLKNSHVALHVGFETLKDGHAPFLRICAEFARHGKLGIQVATAAHKTFEKMNQMGKGAVLGQSLASFAVPLASPEVSV